MQMKGMWWLGLFGIALVLGGQAGEAQAPRPVTVFAAASLTDAFNEIGAAFAKKNPGFRPRFSFAASSLLRTQIGRGAPADVFASADWEQMHPLSDTLKVTTPRVFARNRLVIALPTSNPGKVRALRDLARPGLRLVVTDMKVPIGNYTRQVFEKAVQTKAVPADFLTKVDANTVSREPNVRTLLTKVQLGEADAAIVYESDALAGKRTGRITTAAIPAKLNVMAEYPMAVLAAAKERAGAEKFFAFVVSKEGRTILKRNGFR
jgi:molybdate transport system substrate-binding protein